MLSQKPEEDLKMRVEHETRTMKNAAYRLGMLVYLVVEKTSVSEWGSFDDVKAYLQTVLTFPTSDVVIACLESFKHGLEEGKKTLGD
jgi:hypothetical protein